jgi:hypothetical protein
MVKEKSEKNMMSLFYLISMEAVLMKGSNQTSTTLEASMLFNTPPRWWTSFGKQWEL